MLKIEDLHVRRDEAEVLHGVSLEVSKGEIVALIGANGAGKSTLFESVLGFLRPHRGECRFEGKSLVGLASHEIARLGIACVPEGRRLFPEMSVLENLELGAYRPEAKATRAKNLEFVFHLFPTLAARKAQAAASLSGGEQQMVAIGRALMLDPKLLLMDEVSLGLSPKITELVFRSISEIRKRGVSILLVEQNAVLALETSDRTYAIEDGRISIQGLSKDLIHDPSIRRAYLGL